VCFLSAAASGQTTTGGFITGLASQAWEKWQQAMQAILDRDTAKTEAAFGELLALDPSPFRIALLADHTVQRTAAGGAVLLFEQDREVKALGPNAQSVSDLLVAGREQMNEADDGWYFCQIGRFDVADANFRALLAADPDPAAVLEFTDRVPRRRDILIQLIDNPTVGESVREILKLLDRGERAIKADPTRIKENIERLGGPPRGFENAVEALKDSGEYAVPFIVQYLRDPAQSRLIEPILRCLPQIDRPALNPLVMALRMEDQATKRYLIEALGKIGYTQALPYLLQLAQDQGTPAGLKEAVTVALDGLRAHRASFDPELSAAQAFYQLAQDYYADKPSLAADVRLDTANVWYWWDDLLQNIEVPRSIFSEIMCMRCCEEALRLDHGLKPALALWLAANFRREAQLPLGQQDPTRPDDYPPAAYFAQSAGPDYCLMALARAIDTNDPAVALGAIEALRTTAGPASLIGDASGRLPLAEALSFPDRMVRIRAALTLGYGHPTQMFQNYQNLMPVLSETLLLHAGARNALVVDPDSASSNLLTTILRAQGYEVLTDASLFTGLQKVRQELPAIDVIFIASDIRDPGLVEGLTAMRTEFRFASTPVVLVTKPGQSQTVRNLVRADHRLAAVPENPVATDVDKAVALVSHAVGAKPITPEVGARLAMEAAEVLRLLAVTNNTVFDVADAETALLSALSTEQSELRVTVAEVLGYLGSSKAQEAIAELALNTEQPQDMRVKMFTALAEAAKRRGNLLGPEAVTKIVGIAESDPNLTIREAASRTLGALNPPGEPASQIIRNQYRG
jgi:CheY-like chemotaxis protein